MTKAPGIVTWYNCGPTVYDSSHMGHARFVVFSQAPGAQVAGNKGTAGRERADCFCGDAGTT